MNKVITVNLNGNAYQLEETGYDALRAYLDGATAKLAGNPDREEIISDIEQAIADKLRALLGPYKNVATTAQVQSIIAEMGPVDAGAETPANEPPPRESKSAPGNPPGAAPAGGAKRLYRLRDGEMISGVCNGLAAYLNVDPTIVRLIFVIGTMLTGGIGIVAYLIMSVVIPVASTEAEKNAAHGSTSFTAQEFIRRARAGYYEGMKGFPDREARRAWQRKFKRDMRDWSRSFQWQAQSGVWQGQGQGAAQQHWHNYWSEHPFMETGWSIALPFLTLFNAALAIGFIIMVISLLTDGTLLGQTPPSGLPVWLTIVLLLIAYNFIIWPIKAARHVFYRHGICGARPGPRMFISLWDTFVWIAFVSVLLCLALTHLPEVTEAIHNLPVVLHEAKDNIHQWWSHHRPAL